MQRRAKHTTHLAKNGDGFVHYREGCLCHECPNYEGCRLAHLPIAIGEYDNEIMSTSMTSTSMSPEMTPAMTAVIKALLQNPEGLTVRQLSIKTGYSARHLYRVVKKLREYGFIKKLWELRKEKIISTDLKHYETTEIAHRYVVTRDDIKEE